MATRWTRSRSQTRRTKQPRNAATARTFAASAHRKHAPEWPWHTYSSNQSQSFYRSLIGKYDKNMRRAIIKRIALHSTLMPRPPAPPSQNEIVTDTSPSHHTLTITHYPPTRSLTHSRCSVLASAPLSPRTCPNSAPFVSASTRAYGSVGPQIGSISVSAIGVLEWAHTNSKGLCRSDWMWRRVVICDFYFRKWLLVKLKTSEHMNFWNLESLIRTYRSLPMTSS